jgi:DNA-binding response OmpR family regulator
MKKILIIEDETSLIEVLANKITSEGFEVIKASNGEEGLETALSSHPDLILLDIIMPKMDGITMLTKLREDAWGRNVPVVILTNLSDNEIVARSIQNGVYDYLVKADWNIEDLVVKIKQKLGE